jgi:hypothetical protein
VWPTAWTKLFVSGISSIEITAFGLDYRDVALRDLNRVVVGHD